jgi:hypothetical protein
MAVHKFHAPVLRYATALNQKWFSVNRVLDVGDVVLLRETFGEYKSVTGRAEIFRATSIVNGRTNFTFVPAE